MARMETAFLILGVLCAGWFVLLMRRPRPKRALDHDGPGADPALTKALDDSTRDRMMFERFP